jgi:hypothetical protein
MVVPVPVLKGVKLFSQNEVNAIKERLNFNVSTTHGPSSR